MRQLLPKIRHLVHHSCSITERIIALAKSRLSKKCNITLGNQNENIFCTKILIHKAERQHPTGLPFKYISPALSVMAHEWAASPNVILSVDTTLNLIQTSYPQFLDLEHSEAVLALDSLDPPLSALRLLLDAHRLSLGTHDSGSAHE